MTKENVELRLKEIERAMEQLVANINALRGNREEALYWLSTFNQPENGAVLDHNVAPTLHAVEG